jgi:uncharacterized lipoprotein
MTRNRQIAVVVLVGCTLLLGGCKRLFAGGSCNKPQAYATAKDLPPLKIPAGLDALDTRAAVQVPPLAEPEAPRRKGDPCLDEPPPVAVPAAPAR